MSAQIISLAEFRARRQPAAPLGESDELAAVGLDRTTLAAAGRALAASIEAVRQQALTLHAARARQTRGRKGAGKKRRR